MDKTHLSRSAYIETTYQMMTQEGVGKVSIRKIAAALGCSSAALYKHFDNLEHLITYASIRYLVAYMQELNRGLARKNDALTSHFLVWEAFAKHSFKNVLIYNNLFFGPYSGSLSEIIRDYYSMFGAELSDINNRAMAFWQEGDFVKRDLIMVNMCIEEGFFLPKHAKMINLLDIHIYKGAMKNVLDNPAMDIDLARHQFLSCLSAALGPYVLR